MVIAILDNDHAAVNLVRQAQEEKRRIFFSPITECEVLSGVKHDQFLIAERLFSPRHRIYVDSAIARKAASMQSEQRSKGAAARNSKEI
ncbi:PIN domain-containing protein [Paenibacillus athensensis]|uniref:hypothetical protein n=1 Tax=Paenibacillus athensensis TaxID=1967502 RepID=UPI002E7670EB|nr:hypothetical protein [Paenibacillus athensensis]